MLRRRFEKCINEGSKYAHLIGPYLSFHLGWVLGLFVHGRLQNMKTSEVIFGHNIIQSAVLHLSQRVLVPLLRNDRGPNATPSVQG